MSRPPSPSPKKGPPGIQQIANTLGISIGTVSRSLNNRYGVNPRTRTLVLEEARKIGYVPNLAARSLKQHPSLEVGLFFSPFRGTRGEINPAALSLLECAKAALVKAGMSVRLVLCSNTRELAGQIDGINVGVFYGHFEDTALTLVHDAGIPAVLLQHRESPYPEQVPLVVDTASSGAIAVEYLAALGHEKIGIILSPLSESHSSGLLAGYRKAVAEFHLPSDKSWVRELPPELANKDGGREAMLKLLGLKNRPTAVLFASDWMAFGGLRAAKEAGLRVPQDISLIGFDNLDISSETSPPLTTFDVHMEKEAELLTQLVLDIGLKRQVVDRDQPRKVLISPDLIRRESCLCLRAQKR